MSWSQRIEICGIENRTQDRKTWAQGPWDDEPQDLIMWESMGVPCVLVRGPLGSWCGYAGCSLSHPLYGMGYDHYDWNLHVHGGLTFAGRWHWKQGIILLVEMEAAKRSCLIPKNLWDPDTWYFGFDCANSNDVCPGLSSFGDFVSYKTIRYVRNEVVQIVKFLHKTKDGKDPTE